MAERWLQSLQKPRKASKKVMTDTYCPECKRYTEVVLDHSAGDTVCSECGLVLEAHSIDEASEWRTFANESADNDPVRVGGPSNPLLADGGLSTLISKPSNGGPSNDFLSSSLGRWQNRGSNPDRSLIQAFKTIATMCDRFVCLSFFCLALWEVWDFFFPQENVSFWGFWGGPGVQFWVLYLYLYFFFPFLFLICFSLVCFAWEVKILLIFGGSVCSYRKFGSFPGKFFVLWRRVFLFCFVFF